MTIKQSGYIVTGGDLIWGTGKTSGEAWGDFLATMAQARVEVIYEPAHDMDNKALADKYMTRPATKALIERVWDSGGDCAWREVGGICCTVAEEEAE